MNKFVIGDIHGRKEALQQCLERSGFDKEKDKLIVLGDVVDGGFNTYEVIEELLSIKNLVFIIGNHDEWMIDFIESGKTPKIWINQGGANTLNSYGAEVIPGDYFEDEPLQITLDNIKIPEIHKDFFKRGVYWHEEDELIFVHAGFNPKIPKMSSQSKFDLVWDRNLIKYAQHKIVPGYDKVFVGHTTTQSFGGLTEPLQLNNLYMMDTGAGWSGKLSIMNVSTGQHWTSDLQEPGGRSISRLTIEKLFRRMV